MLFRPRITCDFEKIVNPHSDKLYRLSLRLAGNKSDAEDLLQDVFIKAYTNLSALDATKNVGSWLTTVLYNHFIDSYRREARAPLEELALVETHDESEMQVDLRISDEPSPEQTLLRKEKLVLVQQSLNRLIPEFRAAIILHDIEGYSLQELEDMTKTPRGTLKSRLHRGRKELREHLRKLNYFSDTQHGTSL